MEACKAPEWSHGLLYLTTMSIAGSTIFLKFQPGSVHADSLKYQFFQVSIWFRPCRWPEIPFFSSFKLAPSMPIAGNTIFFKFQTGSSIFKLISN